MCCTSFTYDGELVASFLEHYKSPTENIRLILSGMGLMACSEPHGIVALNRVNSPVLTGYRENGEMAWQVKFDDFDPVHFREYEKGGWSLDFPAAGQSMILSITTDPAGDFYVHYMTFDGGQPVSGQGRGPLFKIDAQTGMGSYLGDVQTGRGRYLGGQPRHDGYRLKLCVSWLLIDHSHRLPYISLKRGSIETDRRGLSVGRCELL